MQYTITKAAVETLYGSFLYMNCCHEGIRGMDFEGGLSVIHIFNKFPVFFEDFILTFKVSSTRMSTRYSETRNMIPIYGINGEISKC